MPSLVAMVTAHLFILMCVVAGDFNCPPGMIVEDESVGVCVDIVCDDGQYYNASEGICENCDQTCSACKFYSNFCSACNSGKGR